MFVRLFRLCKTFYFYELVFCKFSDDKLAYLQNEIFSKQICLLKDVQTNILAGKIRTWSGRKQRLFFPTRLRLHWGLIIQLFITIIAMLGKISKCGFRKSVATSRPTIFWNATPSKIQRSKILIAPKLSIGFEKVYIHSRGNMSKTTSKYRKTTTTKKKSFFDLDERGIVRRGTDQT